MVGVLGHRQVGKTTLLEGIAKEYITFDDETELRHALEDAPAYIAELGAQGTAIDECQLCPPIFPALKERVRKNKRPGQFFMSGSVRFTSKRAIRESLTGRIMNGELLPLTLSELDETELPDLALQILAMPSFRGFAPPALNAREFQRRSKVIQQYLACGGLPGACFLRTASLREQKIRDQLETIFERDLRQVQPTTLPYREILSFVTALAQTDGEPPSHSALYRETGITPPTQKKLLYALEATFVIRHLPIEGDKSGSAVVFEDQAEVLTLAKHSLSAERQWAGLIYRNLREQFAYRIGEPRDFFQYRTRAGVLVPIALRGNDGVLGVVPVLGAGSRAARGAAQSFLRKYARSKVLIVTDQNESRVIDDRLAILPAAVLLF